ncbi:hypothetical protein IG631_00358 [Alternaria alternata]|nr:hypothetical protein IG631_00358 [Alternaria alternata]
MAQRGRQVRVGDRVAFTIINEDVGHTGMALRRVELEIGDPRREQAYEVVQRRPHRLEGASQFVSPQRQMTDRSVKTQSGQTVKGAYERRVTRSQSDWYEQRNVYSQMYHEWLRPGFPRSLDHYETCSIDNPGNNSMETPLSPVGKNDTTSSSRSNPVRLSRSTAVKHNSTKDRKIEIEKHDSTVHRSRASEIAAAHASAAWSPVDARPSNVRRRFSFELADPSDATGLSDTPDFEDIPISPAATDLKRQPALVSEANRLERASFNVSQPRIVVQKEQSHPAAKEERDQEELKDLDRVRRRVLTTFDEILGERKVPTALL